MYGLGKLLLHNSVDTSTHSLSKYDEYNTITLVSKHNSFVIL